MFLKLVCLYNFVYCCAMLVQKLSKLFHVYFSTWEIRIEVFRITVLDIEMERGNHFHRFSFGEEGKRKVPICSWIKVFFQLCAACK